MDYTIHMLQRWQDDHKTGVSKKYSLRMITKECIDASLRCLCQHPLSSLQSATGLPEELLQMILYELLGPFQRVANNDHIIARTGKTTTIASSVSCPQSIHVLQDVEVERDRKDNLSCRKHREAMILIIITLFCIFAKIVIQIIEMVQL